MNKGSLFASVAAVILGVGAASAMLIHQHAPHQAKPQAGQVTVQPQHDDASSGFALLGGAVAGGGGFDEPQSQAGSRRHHLTMPNTPHFMAADGLNVTPPAVPATERKNWSQNFSSFGDVSQGNSVSGGGGGGDQVAMASPDDGSGYGSGAGSVGGGYSGGGGGYGGAGMQGLATPATTPTTTSPTTTSPTASGAGPTAPDTPTNTPDNSPTPTVSGTSPNPTLPINTTQPVTPTPPTQTALGPTTDPTSPVNTAPPVTTTPPTQIALGTDPHPTLPANANSPAATPVANDGNPTGRSPNDPFVETGGTTLPINGCVTAGCPASGWEFFDPAVAVGYDYHLVPTVPGAALTFGITQIQVSTIIGNDEYQLFLCAAGDSTCDVATGIDIRGNGGVTTDDIFDVTAYLQSLETLDPSELALLGVTDPNAGIFGFALRGIDPNAGLDPNDPTTFVTGLMFTGNINGELSITPEVLDTTTGQVTPGHDPIEPIPDPVPEPSSLFGLLTALGLLAPKLRARFRR